MYSRSEKLQLFSIIVILAISLTSVLSMTFTYPGIGSWNIESVFAQLPNDNIIQIISTSTFIDDLGNFHVIGEVNNTSFDPQTNILITTILSDTTNNVIVGNHSAFSSIGTLRPGELSPFDILIQDPQIVGKFNFMEFFTGSQPGIEKPANLVLNGSSAFFDNVGNPHVTGNIINQGQFPEQFLNLVATYYDNSSQGVVGTQSFGLNVGNLSQNQMAPFDITIFDNKTKSQAKFYSLNLDSVQNSMGFPFNPKFSFANGQTTNNEQFVNTGLFTIPPPNNNQGFVIDNNENVGSTGINNNPFGNGGDVLNCEDFDEKNIPVGTNDPNRLDADNDGLGCDSNDNGNSSNGGDVLNCEDFDEKNIPVGTNDPNKLDADNDGIGCETDEGNDTQTDNDENNDNNNNSDDSNPCTAEQASRDHICTSSSGDNDEIDDWTDPPVEEDNNISSENEDENTTTEDSPNNENENESENNDNNEEGSDSEESNDAEDDDSNDESNGEENNGD